MGRATWNPDWMKSSHDVEEEEEVIKRRTLFGGLRRKKKGNKGKAKKAKKGKAAKKAKGKGKAKKEAVEEKKDDGDGGVEMSRVPDWQRPWGVPDSRYDEETSLDEQLSAWARDTQ